MAGGGSLSSLEIEGNGIALGILFIILILFSLGFELITHKIEHFLRKYAYLTLALHKAYKELMILGIVNMLIFVAQEFNLLNFEVNGGKFDILLFEFVHLTLFCATMMYILLVIFVIVALVGTSFRLWSSFEAIDEATAEGLHYVMIEKMSSSWKGRLNPYVWYKRVENARAHYYHKIRHQFMQDHQFGDREVDFSRYLRKCTRKTTMYLLEIDWRLWLLFLAVVILNTGRIALFGEGVRFGPVFFMIVGYLVLLICIIIRIKVHFILKNIAHSATEMKSDTIITDASIEINTFFWFNRPRVISFFFQTSLLVQAVYLAFLIMIQGRHIVDDYDKSVSWFIILISLIPPISVGLFFLPSTFPDFVMATHVRELTDKELLRQARAPPRNSVSGVTHLRDIAHTISRSSPPPFLKTANQANVIEMH